MSDTEEHNVREGQRIAKVMARAGLCSRRDAEAWIAEGRVSVNGELLDTPAYNVSEADDVRVDGKPLKAAERTRLFLFHKPRGLVTTARDPEGRSTIFDALPPDLPRVVAIGRLDINTEGLLLLTNDGGLSRVLELPSTGWLRRYRVRAHGEVRQEQLDALREGVSIDGMHYAGIDARFERQQGANVWLTMGLREGKNREIKRVLEHLGLEVNRLIRVSFGPFEMGDLGEGEVAEVRTRVLRDQLGPKLAKQAGVDLDSPLEPAPAPEPAPVQPAQAGVGDSHREATHRQPHSGREAPRSRRPAEGGFKPRTGAKGVQGRLDRSAVAAELAARGERRETVAPRKRKHVSALRAQTSAEEAGPRKRIERSATADRKGRVVEVERVMKARPQPEAAERDERRPLRPRSPSGEAREPRSFSPRGARFGGAGEEGGRSSRPRASNEGGPEKRSFSPRGARPGGAGGEGGRSSRPRASNEGGPEKRSFSPRGARPGGAGGEGGRSSRPRASNEGGPEKRSFSPRGARPGGAGGEGGRSSRPSASNEGAPEKRSFSPRGARPGGAGGEGGRSSRPSASNEGAPEKRSFSPRGARPGGAGGEGGRSSRPSASNEGAPEKRSFSPRGARYGAAAEEGGRSSRPRSPSERGQEGRGARSDSPGRRPASAAKDAGHPKRSFSPRPAGREGRPPRPGGDKPRGGSGKRPPRKG